jgi:antitoxin VapB
MKCPGTRRTKRARKSGDAAKPARTALRRAAIFRNGRNQAVRLPQDLKFPDKVKEVQVRKQGDSILLSPVRPDWASFFSLEASVPDEFLTARIASLRAASW